MPRTRRGRKRGGHGANKPVDAIAGESTSPVNNGLVATTPEQLGRQHTFEDVVGGHSSNRPPASIADAGLYIMAAHGGWMPDYEKGGKWLLKELIDIYNHVPKNDHKLRERLLKAIDTQRERQYERAKDAFSASCKMLELGVYLPGQEIANKESEDKTMDREEFIIEQVEALDKSGASLEQVEQFFRVLETMGYKIEE